MSNSRTILVGPAKSHLIETEIKGEISIYNTRNEQVTILNSTASDIWRLADGHHTVTEIAEKLASSYGVSANKIISEVAETVDELSRENLIETS